VHPVESEPRLAAVHAIDAPVGACRPLLRAEPLPVEPRPLLNGVVAFLGEHVHRRVREVVEPSGVIEVEVCEDDVAHLAGVVTELLGLAYRRELLGKIGCDQREKNALRRLRDSRTSRRPRPVSTSTSPLAVSIRRQ